MDAGKQSFVREHVQPGATFYTDEVKTYVGIPEYDHEEVTHSLSECMKSGVHTNEIKSLWPMIKRAHRGTFHKLLPKHLGRYVQEFAARHDLRESDTLEIMAAVVGNRVGKRLRYADLVADNGLSSAVGS